MSEEKIMKALKPCYKKAVTLEELIDECYLVQKCLIFPITRKNTKEGSTDGIMTFSISISGGLNFCVWQKKNDVFECISRNGTDYKTFEVLCGLEKCATFQLNAQISGE